MERKSELRRKHIQIRNEMSYEERLSHSHSIMESVVSSYDFLSAKHVLIYASYGSEVITKGIMEYAFMLKKKVYCPKVISETKMEFYEIHSIDDLKEGYKGIPEPEAHKENMFVPYDESCDDSCDDSHSCNNLKNEKALMIMPGVCFDEAGHRIGYGKGFYDRYLECNPSLIKMALAFESQVEETIPCEETDILYDILVTELRTICLLEEEEE